MVGLRTHLQPEHIPSPLAYEQQLLQRGRVLKYQQRVLSIHQQKCHIIDNFAPSDSFIDNGIVYRVHVNKFIGPLAAKKHPLDLNS